MVIEIKSELFEDVNNQLPLTKLIQDLVYKRKYEVFINYPVVESKVVFIGLYDYLKDIIFNHYK